MPARRKKQGEQLRKRLRRVRLLSREDGDGVYEKGRLAILARDTVYRTKTGRKDRLRSLPELSRLYYCCICTILHLFSVLSNVRTRIAILTPASTDVKLQSTHPPIC